MVADRDAHGRVRRLAIGDWRLAIGDCGDPLDAGRCVGLLGGEFYRATGRGGEGFLPAEATEAGAQPPRRTGSGQAAKPNDEPSTHEPNSTDVEHDHVKSFTALPGGVEYEEELRSQTVFFCTPFYRYDSGGCPSAKVPGEISPVANLPNVLTASLLSKITKKSTNNYAAYSEQTHSPDRWSTLVPIKGQPSSARLSSAQSFLALRPSARLFWGLLSWVVARWLALTALASCIC